MKCALTGLRGTENALENKDHRSRWQRRIIKTAGEPESEIGPNLITSPVLGLGIGILIRCYLRLPQSPARPRQDPLLGPRRLCRLGETAGSPHVPPARGHRSPTQSPARRARHVPGRDRSGRLTPPSAILASAGHAGLQLTDWVLPIIAHLQATAPGLAPRHGPRYAMHPAIDMCAGSTVRDSFGASTESAVRRGHYDLIVARSSTPAC